MDGLTLLQEALAAGLEVWREGDRLVVRGPTRLERLAKALLAQKAAVLPLLTWDEATADRLLQATLARVAAAYRAAYRERFLADPRWLEAEGRIEAAALLHDMPAFLRALREYEAFARRAFAEWAAEEAVQ
jgi:hypothetical protein